MSNDYADRFAPSTYEDDELVCFSVSISSRSDRQTVDLPERLFVRAQAIARAHDLHLLPVIELYGETSLNKHQCATLFEELSFIRTVVNDNLLAEHLSKVLQALSTCINCAGPAAVLIEGP
jgi:hypothetical protein